MMHNSRRIPAQLPCIWNSKGGGKSLHKVENISSLYENNVHNIHLENKCSKILLNAFSMELNIAKKPTLPKIVRCLDFIFSWYNLFFIDRHSTDREVAIMMLMAYLSYMVAEVTKAQLCFNLSKTLWIIFLLELGFSTNFNHWNYLLSRKLIFLWKLKMNLSAFSEFS